MRLDEEAKVRFFVTDAGVWQPGFDRADPRFGHADRSLVGDVAVDENIEPPNVLAPVCVRIGRVFQDEYAGLVRGTLGEDPAGSADQGHVRAGNRLSGFIDGGDVDDGL